MSSGNEYLEIKRIIKSNWDKIAKPLDSLGKFEEVIARLGAIQGEVCPRAEKTAALILCGDNGIVEEGISQSDQSVTRICAENIAAGKTVAGIMARQAGAQIIVVDMGMAPYGTKNFLKEPAMSHEAMECAVQKGTDLVLECKNKGFDVLCIGEMGIGNTTTSAAVAAALLGVRAAEVTGRGAGLDDKKLEKKISVVQQAIDKYGLYEADALTVLQIVGGFDIAGMVGVYLGAKKYGLPVILDGAISMVAALVASKIDSNVTDYLISSHISREPLAQKIVQLLELNPVLDADMALGEGTGALLMLGLVKTVIKVYEESVPFDESRVEQYKRYV